MRREMPSMRLTLPLLVLFVFVAGCGTYEETSELPADQPVAGTPANQGPSASMAKCAGCGKEVAASTLASHDGQQLCPDCIAAHGH